MKIRGTKVAESGKSKPKGIEVARRNHTTTPVTVPNQGDRAFDTHFENDLRTHPFHAAAGPVKTPLPEASRPSEPAPVWLSVLLAASCSAGRNGEEHTVRWHCAAGRATYTNHGGEAERIEPLGVSLLGGHTMAVYWNPGETAYTVEVYRQNEKCA